eukprot:gnl/Trimastix_PCT/380.p2 GENE.gnl/Trimastix_PCT/380~~gnl/Trimastix_PCT/380.p2  ORF type:complete len:169 (-),score=14.61 gnl/Trimastix_PCT/380:24-530(-)
MLLLEAVKDLCPVYAPFFGFMGCACALVFANLGSCYGTAKAGVGVCAMGVLHPQLVMKSTIPTIMAGVLGIYGLIIAVLINTAITDPGKYSMYTASAHLSAGLCCGFSALAAGICLGIVGDAGVRANARQPKLFVGMMLILIFGEALAIYGLIIAIILYGQKYEKCTL